MKLPVETINKLQLDPECIRNICILAHVDHGKTSLSDSLLATNGIISQRMAGKTRFLDSREDEQLRGITMESSAISLYFKTLKKSEDNDTPVVREHLINLIDSPGHIDFSSEVSTASRLCDGAIVMVDVVEGVCSQTINVLRQCWVDKLKPILVLNKIDRLITEWQLSPLEAYHHLSRTIEQVNSVIGSFYSGERMEDDYKWREKGSVGDFVEKDDADLYFSPESNNVIFASAYDGWAFSINTFASFVLKKLGFSQNVLSKTLWGDFYLDMKNKKIIPGKKLKSSQTNLKLMFVSLILDQIWAIYDACILNRDDVKLERIVERLNVKVSPRDLRSKDYKSLLNVIMSQWIPVSHAVLGMVIDYLPSPVKSQDEKMTKLLTECIFNNFPTSEPHELIDSEFEKAIKSCESSDPDYKTLAYVSKMLSIPKSDLPKDFVTPALSKEELKERTKKAREAARKASEAAAAAQEASKENEADEYALPLAVKDPFEWEYEEDYFEEEEDDIEETLIAFTRVFSGSLSRGQKVTIIGPKYDPTLPKDSLTNITQIFEDIIIQDLYLIMGKDLTRMDTVPAGNIVGVVGLDNIVLKNATIISNTPEMNYPFINLASTSTLIHNKPIMKITIEPTNLLHLGKLERGLDLLSKADPVFEWCIDDDTGELIMFVAGELHLERCVKDLKDRFAKGCEVTIKEPVIPFREGLDPLYSSAYKSEELFTHEIEGLVLDFEVYALPLNVVKFLIESEHEITAIRDLKIKNKQDEQNIIPQFVDKLLGLFDEDDNIDELLTKTGFKTCKDIINNLISFGPKRIGPNMLVESLDNGGQFRHLLSSKIPELPLDYESHVTNGFQLAMSEGPLASEPLQGVLVLLRKVEEVAKEEDEDNFLLGTQGRIITHTRDLIHQEFIHKGARLFLAMYTCEIQAATEALGKVYAVVQKRGGRIVSEELKEGTPFFTVVARVPVIEAYGFSEEVRIRTSGAATPQLVFDGFDMLEIDPFWVPHTEEELEELGTFAERENVARKYMNNIRRRKGLFVDEKVVKNAEKQRNMKKD